MSPMGSPARRDRPQRHPTLAVPGALAIVALALLAPLAAAASGGGPLQAQAGGLPARPRATVIVTEAADGRSLNLRRGEQLQVVLAETAGTGYLWQVASLDRRLLQLEGQTSWQDPGPPPPPGVRAPVGLVGGPMQVSFLFRAVAAGEGVVLLRHWRPWEGPRSVDRQVRLRLRVVD